MTIPVAGYVRVSRVGARDQSDGFISPDVQEKAIREYCARHGLEVVMQPHELNVSGGTMNRPVFNEVLDQIREGQLGGIIVYKLDRFARTLLGALTTLEELGRHNAAFASATEEQLDYVTPAGRAFVNMLFVFAQFVRETLTESWHETQRHAIEKGIHISPNGFLGYSKGANRRLVPNEDAPIVMELFDRRGDGETWSALTRWLNQAAPKPDGTLWTDTTVKNLCAKRVYRGEASRYVRQDKANRGAVINPDAHDALVTEEQWRAAQMTPRLYDGGKIDKPLPLLSGLIRCAGCRYSMSIGNGSKGERLYRCRRRHVTGVCPAPAQIIAEHIEQYVEELALAEIPETVRPITSSTERERIEAALNQAHADLEDFRKDREARRKLGADWHSWLDTYLDAVSELEAELAQIDQGTNPAQLGLTRRAYLDGSVEERRDWLGGFTDCIMVRPSKGRGRNVDPVGRRARVLWRGEGPADLPRRATRNRLVSYVFEDEVEPGMAST